MKGDTTANLGRQGTLVIFLKLPTLEMGGGGKGNEYVQGVPARL